MTLYANCKCRMAQASDCGWCKGTGFAPASTAELTAEIRARVESGTIKGEVLKRVCVEHRAWLGNSDPSTVCRVYSYVRLYQGRPNPCKIVERILIGPVSDGGTET